MDVYIKKGTVFYSISDGVIAGLAAYSGTGLSSYHSITERGPFQHGESYIDFRLDPRELILSLIVKASSASALQDKLDDLTELCKPRSSGLVPMKFVTDTGVDKRAEVYYVDGIGLTRAIGDGVHYKVPLALRVPSGVFSAPTSGAVSYYMTDSTVGFIIPMTVPFEVGSSSVNISDAIIYTGTWRTYPVITIIGPLAGCVITNVSTDDKLDFTGITIPTGDWRTIDCRFGYKTVVNSSGTSCVSDLAEDSDLGTFHFAPDPDLIDGNNAITITGTQATSNTQINIVYDILYAAL